MKVLRVLKHARVSALRARVEADPSALDDYDSAPTFAGITEDDLLNTPLTVPDEPPKLELPSGNKRARAADDAEHAIRVYQYLGPLTRTQAADPRLWVALAHTTFWDYVRARWGSADRDTLKTAVLRHWFVPEGGSKATLRTQAISRLWWAAKLTCAPWEQDPELGMFKSADRFRFTRILLRQQQIYFDLVERDFGSDLRLRTCVLDALDRHLPSVTWKDGLSIESSKRLNLLIKHAQIGSLDLPQLTNKCDELVARVAADLQAAPSAEP